MKPADHFHGSDLEKIEAVYGIAKADIISFSANVNPLGLSGHLRKTLAEQLDVITGYPDREYTGLRKVIGEYCGADYDHIIVGNGSTELISLFIQLRKPKKALIIGPTYSEYEREISLGGGISLYFPLDEANDFELNEQKLCERLDDSIDLLVICNPNNPTSTAICHPQMRRILDACKKNDIYVMIDETYVEFAENYSQITAAPLTDYYNNLIILRGISKFFAAPGLRLGYAITGNKDLIKEVNRRKNPWTINSLAEAAGQILFTDTAYMEATRTLIHTERKRIAGRLREIDGIKVYEPVANFVLVRSMNEGVTARRLFETCIRQGLMIRDCSTFPFLDSSYFRFCFMKAENNDRLLDCIRGEFL